MEKFTNLKPSWGKVVSVFAKNDIFCPSPESLKLNWEKVITEANTHGEFQNHQKYYKDILKKAMGIK